MKAAVPGETGAHHPAPAAAALRAGVVGQRQASAPKAAACGGQVVMVGVSLWRVWLQR